MKQIFAISAVLFLCIACDKDSFETKPQIKLKSQSTSVVPVQGDLRLVFEYTDKEGDVSDTLFFIKERINQRVVATLRDSLDLIVPEFPKTSEGELIVTLDYGNYLISAQEPPRSNPGELPARYESDTLNLKFVLKDKAGNKSDTLRIDNLEVQRSR